MRCPFQTYRISWVELWEKIHCNYNLQELEVEGFYRGKQKGKTMNVPLHIIMQSIDKQHEDLTTAYINTPQNYKNLKQRLADLRNVAGCAFLKIEEWEQLEEKKGKKK